MQHYGLPIWGDDNFYIDADTVKVNYKSSPSLKEIVTHIRAQGTSGPLILRFPHLIEKQIKNLYNEFSKAKKTFNYQSDFNAVFPLKVNQFPNFIKHLTRIGHPYNYGLEAGSKAELFIALSHNNVHAPITVNGFKDKEMITLCFLAAQMGHNISIIIEGITELESIIELAQELGSDVMPNIGIRVRLHSSGVGIWAKSGGINAKFGLSSTELIKALKMMEKHQLQEKFKMIHFHIGSQISNINPLKKALREAGNIYAELKRSGAMSLDSINIGGGLAVEYATNEKNRVKNYSLEEYANDVIFSLQSIALSKDVDEPHIFIESGRYIAAPHATLIAPVLELFSHEYSEKELNLKDKNPPLIEELHDLYQTINEKNAREYLHDAHDHMESLLTLFDLGYIDLQDRSNSEILVHIIINKALALLKNENYAEVREIQNHVQERYLVNFSLFQSIPDYWGLGQNFPVMPLSHLDTNPSRSASLWDITCDSDGEIPYNEKNPLFLHDIDVEEEEYFLAFFLIGAYQEVLGMKHNLFARPSEIVVEIDEKGFYIKDMIKSQDIIEILDDIDYDTKKLTTMTSDKIDAFNHKDKAHQKMIKETLSQYIHDHGYLKTIQGTK